MACCGTRKSDAVSVSTVEHLERRRGLVDGVDPRARTGGPVVVTNRRLQRDTQRGPPATEQTLTVRLLDRDPDPARRRRAALARAGRRR